MTECAVAVPIPEPETEERMPPWETLGMTYVVPRAWYRDEQSMFCRDRLGGL